MAGEYSTEALDRHFQAIGKRLDHIEEQLNGSRMPAVSTIDVRRDE